MPVILKLKEIDGHMWACVSGVVDVDPDTYPLTLWNRHEVDAYAERVRAQALVDLEERGFVIVPKDAVDELVATLTEARGWVELCEDMCKDVTKPLAAIDAAIAKYEEKASD